MEYLKIIQKIPEQHTGKVRSHESKKTAILGTAHILLKMLMYNYKRFNTGSSFYAP
jgi:hypothetical protein